MRLPRPERLQSSDNITKVNKTFTDLFLLFEKGISFKDHFDCVIEEVVLDGTYPKFIYANLKRKPETIMYLNYKGDDSLVTANPLVKWGVDNNRISIKEVVGVSPTNSNKLTLKLLIF